MDSYLPSIGLLCLAFGLRHQYLWYLLHNRDHVRKETQLLLYTDRASLVLLDPVRILGRRLDPHEHHPDALCVLWVLGQCRRGFFIPRDEVPPENVL